MYENVIIKPIITYHQYILRENIEQKELQHNKVACQDYLHQDNIPFVERCFQSRVF